MGNKYNGSINRVGDADDKAEAAGNAQRRTKDIALALEGAADGHEFADRQSAKDSLHRGLGNAGGRFER